MEGDAEDVVLTASDATQAHFMHTEKSKRVHKRHLNACRARLRTFIKEQPDQTCLVYQVPLIVIGSALRDARTVLNGIIQSLRQDGFNAHYLGANLIFISWKAAHATPMIDHVGIAVRQKPLHPVVLPLTAENLRVRGPGEPHTVMSDVELTRARVERDFNKRMQQYEQSNADTEKQKYYQNVRSHEDALRRAVHFRNHL